MMGNVIFALYPQVRITSWFVNSLLGVCGSAIAVSRRGRSGLRSAAEDFEEVRLDGCRQGLLIGD
jgi:hypothetical protein